MMKMKLSIIKTKFIPPIFRDTYVLRPKLTNKLSQALDYPLTFIHAGAGYGKSASLSSFSKETPILTCWYSISKQEDEFLPFLIHLLCSIRSKVPEFGSSLLTFLEHNNQQLLDDTIDFICSELINELTLLENDFLIILDDFHLLEKSKQIEKCFELLLKFLPPQIHFVISSRTKLNWSLFTSLLVKGNILEVGKEDFIFSKDEMEVLFLEYFEDDLPQNQLEMIHELTEGWIIAIRMFQQHLISNPQQLISTIKVDSVDDLFRYLALEVFMDQSREIKEFLLLTSTFDQFSSSICKDVLGIRHADQLINELLTKNLFLTGIGEKQYRYHALFKDFLQNQLKQDKKKYEKTHRALANFYLKNEIYENAVDHYLLIEDYGVLAALLTHVGQSILDKGKLEFLQNVLLKIPENIVEEHYPLYLILAEIFRYQCKYESAIAAYRKLEYLSKKSQDPLVEGFSVEGQAKVYLDTIQPRVAQDLLGKSIRIYQDSKTDISADKKIELYSLMAENLVNLGSLEQAEQWINKIKQINQDYENVELESRFHLRAGKLQEAEDLLRRNRSRVEPALSKSHRETDLLLSLIYSFTGDGEEAKVCADAGLEHGIKRKSPFVEACGWIRKGHALQLENAYNKQAIINAYETALRMMEELDVSRGKAEPLMGLCLLYGKNYDYRLALYYGEKALMETERVEDHWLSSLIRLSIGIAAFFNGKVDDAKTKFQDCLIAFQECNSQFGLMVTHFWMCLLRVQAGNEKEIEKNLAALISIVKSLNYRFFFTRKTLFGPNDLQVVIPLLLFAKNKKIESDYVEELLKSLGVKEDISYHPGYTLTIKTFGDFEVWLGDQVVDEKAWKRERAKELLQLLITYKNGLSKSDILSLIWGDSEEESAGNEFKVAFNALNNAIEPHRKARAKSYFITRSTSRYLLNPNAAIHLDRDQFEKMIEAGLVEKDKDLALETLKAALRLYTGDFLLERRDDGWSAVERDRLRILFLRGAERVAQLHLSNEEFEETIRYCDEILAIDPCWEEAYRLLIYCYYRKNNRPYALKLYEKCCEILEKEMCVEPLESTTSMYQMILEAK